MRINFKKVQNLRDIGILLTEKRTKEKKGGLNCVTTNQTQDVSSATG